MAKTPTSVDTDALTRQITRTPFPGSRKIYLDGTRADIRVPFREISLTDTLVHEGQGEPRREANPPLRVYDASGPYTDPSATIDITRGLPGLRWQGPTEPATTNAQRLALQIDAEAFGLPAAELQRWLAAEGVPTRVLAGPPGRAGLLLPQNAAMSDDDVHAVCALVRDAQACAAAGEG